MDDTATVHGSRLPSIRVALAAIALLCAVGVWQTVQAPMAEASPSGLSFISSSTWTADLGAGQVHVLVAITATSHAEDTATRRYYYDRLQLKLPFGSAGYAASSDGRPLALTVLASDPTGVIVSVGLGQRLFAGQSLSLDLAFDLVDQPENRDLRIGRNLMSFPVTAFGSPGAPGSSVIVVFPPGLTIAEEFGGLPRAVLESGQVVFTSGAIDDPTTLSAWFTATKPVPVSDFSIRSIAIGPLAVALRYWEDDPGWADQVERTLRAGYPILRDLIGVGDPIGKSITIGEASTQEVGGFSGAYDQVRGQVHISYLADPFVILHEAAHLWFTSDLSTDRWINEGFASYYAQQAIARLGWVDHAPVLTEKLRRAAIPLSSWNDVGEPSSATDGYLYARSLDVARQIAALAGQDGLSKVWQAARLGTAAYQPVWSHNRETVLRAGIDWRTFLDLLEQTTGRPFVPIWRGWVADSSQAAQIEKRGATLSAYAESIERAGKWDLPPEIRRALDTWQFNQATAFMARARAILVQRDQIVDESAAERATPPATLKSKFETAGTIAASEEASRELAVLNELRAAGLARTDGRDAARILGLLGADPQADLEAARRAFSEGDLDRALSLAASARSSWEGATIAGRARIFGFVCLLLGLALLVLVVLWSRRSRSGRSPAGALLGPPSPAAAGATAPPARSSGIGASTRSATPVAAIAAARAESDGEGNRQPHHLAGDRYSGSSGGIRGNGDGHDDGRDAGVEWSGDASPGSSGDSPYELLQRGQALLEDRHNAQAAVVLERAARVEPGKGSILEALGRAYFNSGQHARAAETFEALLEIDPAAHYGHFALGLSFSRLGRSQEARTHLRLAAAMDPTSETYRKALEKIESKTA
jgi:tetratricopeptide (TPR) repeat protein